MNLRLIAADRTESCRKVEETVVGKPRDDSFLNRLAWRAITGGQHVQRRREVVVGRRHFGGPGVAEPARSPPVTRTGSAARRALLRKQVDVNMESAPWQRERRAIVRTPHFGRGHTRIRCGACTTNSPRIQESWLSGAARG